MSVEAPNSIKFQSQLSQTNKHQNSFLKTEFENALKYESAIFSQRSDHTPKSPQKNIVWMEYNGASKQNTEDVLMKLNNEKKPILLKFTNVKSNEVNFLGLLKGISTRQNMQHLIVRHSNLSLNHMQTIARVLQLNDGIAWLVLDKNKIDDRGIRYLAEGLEKNKGVEHIVLSDNNFGDEGIIELSKAVKNSPKVKSLWIQGNHIQDQGVEALMVSLNGHPGLKTLDIRDNYLSNAKKELLKNICNQNGIRLYA